MISKSKNHSYHDGTSAFFNVFTEKDPHDNAVENKKEAIEMQQNVCACLK